MASSGRGVSCVSCVVKPYAPANEDDQRRRCPQGATCGCRTKGPKDRDEVLNVRRSKRPLQSILTLPSLWRLQRYLPSIWQPSIRHCDAAVRPLAGVPIGMQSTPDAAKKGEMCTGWCRTLFGCILQHVKSRQWL